jgi:putative thioredoxin
MERIIGQGAGETGGKDGAQAPLGDLIKDTTARTFAADVLEASRAQPVIVDFWAPWCGPCKQLTPILEKLVKEAKGAVKLVKINIDENQDIARQMRIQSIPAVFAFRGGQPVDGFMGALPEAQVRAFIQRLGGDTGPSPVEELSAIAEDALAQGDVATAAQAFGQILQDDPQNAAALAGLARCYLQSGDLARASQTLDLVPPDKAAHETVVSVRAALMLSEQAGKAGDAAPLQAKVDANPTDHQARYDLALALSAHGRNEEALNALLEIIRRDRSWNEGAARQQLLTFFDALGPNDPLVAQGRRKLSSILFS